MAKPWRERPRFAGVCVRSHSGSGGNSQPACGPEGGEASLSRQVCPRLPSSRRGAGFQALLLWRAGWRGGQTLSPPAWTGLRLCRAGNGALMSRLLWGSVASVPTPCSAWWPAGWGARIPQPGGVGHWASVCRPRSPGCPALPTGGTSSGLRGAGLRPTGDRPTLSHLPCPLR